MKKLLSALISAAVIAMPLAVISTPVVAKTGQTVQAAKAGDTMKAKSKSKSKGKAAGKKKMKKKA